MDGELLDQGCQCPNGFPPCEFCVNMTEEEADAYAIGGIVALKRLVNGSPVQLEKPCNCSGYTLLHKGCVCGHFKI